MKQKFLLTTLLFCSLLWNAAKAIETEPNNTKAQANTLALNGSNSGKINPAGDQDWWKVVTTADGRLDITLTPLSGRNTYVYLYDNNGATQLAGTYSTGAFTISADGLAAGTYYLKVICYFSTDTSSYTIANKLVQPAQANDAEPDSTKAQALVLPLNGSATGHIDYYYNNHRDTSDWYKVTTNGDGLLRLTLNPVNGQNVYMTLFDNDGKTVLISQYGASQFSTSTDGLAAGTYYVRVYTYFNTGFAPYVLSDSLFKPTQANDAEPDSTKAQALVLPLNGSATGHIDYYYKNHRDSVDWYKVTTNADGLLRISLTPANGQYTYATLYDNDGITVLNSSYSSGPFNYSTDGLAAGTYYVRIYTYYNTGFAPYILSDSLFTPAQANDAEPNDNKAQAIVLPLNATKAGHIGYYYNNHRDTSDWYKLTTNKDGLLRLSLTPVNGQYTYVTLYDHDGTTVLNSQYSSGPFNYSTDGLAAGTYYLRVYNYYSNSGFAPYILSDSLFTYTDTADTEPNNQPYLSKTLPANGTVQGHVGFYYNNQRDSSDWWKINYTGSGALTVTANFEPTKLYSYQYTYLQVFKDTLAAPIYSQYTAGASLTASLTALTQGYYWVRIITYYNTQFEAYSLSNTFTQVNKAKIKLISSVSAPDCSSTNSLTLKCSGSKPPYSVQLIRFGINYSSSRVVNNTNAFTFTNLPYGVYTAKVFGDGATGTAFTKLTPVTLAAIPTNLAVTNITGTQAKLNWTAQTCVSYYTVQYRKLGDTGWTTKNTVGSVSSYLAKPLTVSTSYEWHVAPVDSSNGVSGTGTYSVLDTFTTAASFVAATQSFDESMSKGAVSGNDRLTVYPNPAVSSFSLSYSASKPDAKVSAVLRDMNGSVVWSNNNTNAAALSSVKVDVSRLASGIYMLQLTDFGNNTIITKKVVVTK